MGLARGAGRRRHDSCPHPPVPRRLSGTVPFGSGAADENAIFKAIQTEDLKFGTGWTTITGAAKELIAGCLEKDPAKRYTVEQALDHPWVSGDAASDKPIERAIVDALLAFNARNKLKKAAIRLVAANLTAKDVQDMRSAFMRIDKDNSGFITAAELTGALREMGMADKDGFRALVEAVDVDKDGLVSWEVRRRESRYHQHCRGGTDTRRSPLAPPQEFLHATLEAQMVKHQQKIWEAFCELDSDGSGTITVDELRRVLKDEPTETIEKYIAEYDTDKDGTINYEVRHGVARRIAVVPTSSCACSLIPAGVPPHAAAKDAQIPRDQDRRVRWLSCRASWRPHAEGLRARVCEVAAAAAAPLLCRK